MNILLVEDDQTLNQNISAALKTEAINTTSVFDGLLAERILKRQSFDCIIMDINLPGRNGFELCRNFREYNTSTPVIMLTAFSELDDKIEGFNCGADDYLTKPFFMRELILRVNALIKRKSALNNSNPIISVDDIVVDTRTKNVSRKGQPISLTPREYQILLKLLKNKNEIVSKNDLITEIWGTSLDINTNTIEVYVNFLRNKIDKPFGKNSIKTKIGYGYYLEVE